MESAALPGRQFSVRGKLDIVTVGGIVLGLCMEDAMAEAGADSEAYSFIRYIGRLQSPNAEFLATQDLAGREHVGSLHSITSTIFQPTNVIDYSPGNVTKTMDMGLLMTAQVVARQMMEYECVGLIMLAASMSRLVTIKGLNALVYTSSKVAAIQLERSLTRGLELIHCAQGTF
ncbi:oxidoreductase [Histoplasma capsulatum var. duboisii H88]|uniref:Oxidoreductase n=1 Tax=Ajellomyces capsulatus (strain H88) TaxID=544711 RepID=F0U7W1_AJEC8|nr:oxidoreductase [Histoplasma capsulatum var. duboisii H88]